ncbi:ATP-binding protein [Streptomyces sp. BPPL-273]|uniref:ATP-binding protein n=1 Tax=Streptomyces sp. BPPL-273 TaxID=2987533 RepID=UPI0024AEA6C9|nr:ATP-binding protein [Streptomyces sp. BPPL-273]WHM29260.1 ATP-binding protein [Streptomyces sp. BPPL-273]
MKDYLTGNATVESVPVASSKDVVQARQVVRNLAQRGGLSLVHQTKLVTAASELARNMVVYGGGGVVRAAEANGPQGVGVFVEFRDDGPGIRDVEQALTDGWSSGRGMGLGLSGAQRLVNEFDIQTGPDGTTVTIVKWNR